MSNNTRLFSCRFYLMPIVVVMASACTVQAADLFVSYVYANTVHRFGPTGNNLGTFATIVGPGPHGLAFDSRRNLYVAGAEGNIWKFGPTGIPLGALSGSDSLGGIGDLVVDSDDNLYAAAGSPTVHIHKYGPDGANLGSFASLDASSSPRGIAFDGSGNLYVADKGAARRILKFSPTGANLGTFAPISGDGGPNGLAFDRSGNLYVTYYGDSVIHKFGPNGADLGTFANTGLNHPYGIAFDDRGDMYVTNTCSYPGPYECSIHKFGPNGQDLGTFANTGQGTAPEWLAFMPDLAPGDFDNDGDVDGRDFLAWQRNPSIGDLSDWQANYGTGSLTSKATIVPEPASFVLFCIVSVALMGCRIATPLRRKIW